MQKRHLPGLYWEELPWYVWLLLMASEIKQWKYLNSSMQPNHERGIINLKMHPLHTPLFPFCMWLNLSSEKLVTGQLKNLGSVIVGISIKTNFSVYLTSFLLAPSVTIYLSLNFTAFCMSEWWSKWKNFRFEIAAGLSMTPERVNLKINLGLQNRGASLTTNHEKFRKVTQIWFVYGRSRKTEGNRGSKTMFSAELQFCSYFPYKSCLSFYHSSQSYTVVRKYRLDRPTLSFSCLFLLWNLFKTQTIVCSQRM